MGGSDDARLLALLVVIGIVVSIPDGPVVGSHWTSEERSPRGRRALHLDGNREGRGATGDGPCRGRPGVDHSESRDDVCRRDPVLGEASAAGAGFRGAGRCLSRPIGPTSGCRRCSQRRGSPRCLSGTARWVALNLLVSVLALYFIHGLAIIRAHLARWIGRGWLVRWGVAFVALQMPLPAVVALLGLVDAFRPLRPQPNEDGGQQ